MVSDASISFPTNVEEFGGDERISYSLQSKTYVAVHEDGSEFEFNEEQKKWIPIDYDQDDDDLPSLPEENDGTHALDDQSKKRKSGPSYDDEPAPSSCANPTTLLCPPSACAVLRYRRNTDKPKTVPGESDPNRMGKLTGQFASGQQDPSQGRKQRPTKKAKPPPAPKQNTAVYVTGLPLDATIDEVYDLFSKKGGVIAEEIDSGKPRIKMYNDEQGNFKGDALVVFFKPQSVEMAITLLDDTDFRYTSSGLTEGKIRVQPADSSYKKTNYDQDTSKNRGAEGRKPQKSERDRQKIIRKTQKLDAKLADWDDDVPYPGQEDNNRTSKVVILKYMFTLQELEEDPAALLEIKEDIREECEKLGEVTNVVLYDLEPEGYVSVKFRDANAAEACVQLMDGRNFDGRVVEARLSFRKERFKLSSKKQDEDE
ncbi:hypothetical protein jhhlp_002218 [Lomentospora prolificans]|uniref:RRM domain-containing protein n=1 Tax=Lomentospora prolificans TaxID=41688 RepID=A0A2N3NDI8_9PEZI|nr:hypothetical protein jhhlp_002218 [Lomentospora prolificans]